MKMGRRYCNTYHSEQYRNMAEIISTCMHLIDNAKKHVKMQM